MDMFMPSEVARLVLGYLTDMNCISTIRVYLTENPHLKEYVSCLHQGREYPTSIAGKSLIDILQDYCHTKTIEKNPMEICKLINRIEGNLAQVKFLATNGHMRSGALTSSITNHTTAQKTATRIMLMSTRKEQEEILEKKNADTAYLPKLIPVQHVTVATETSPNGVPVLLDHFTQTHNSSMVDASTQFVEDVQTTVSSGLCSNTACPTTPICRPLDLYTSPSSLVKSALMLNFGIEAFQTPNKEKYLSEDGIWRSPRRKNQVPRKRLSYSPASATKKQNGSNSAVKEADVNSNENVDVTALIDELLHNTALHERIAANINNVVSNKSISTCSGPVEISEPVQPEPLTTQFSSNIPIYTNTQEDPMPETVIKTIVDRTESDPMFEAFLNIFLDKQDSNSRDSQIELCSNAITSPDTHGTPDSEIHSETPMYSHTPCSDQLVQTTEKRYFSIGDHNTPESREDGFQHPDSSGLETPGVTTDRSSICNESVLKDNGQICDYSEREVPSETSGISPSSLTDMEGCVSVADKSVEIPKESVPSLIPTEKMCSSQPKSAIDNVQRVIATRKPRRAHIRMLKFATPEKRKSESVSVDCDSRTASTKSSNNQGLKRKRISKGEQNLSKPSPPVMLSKATLLRFDGKKVSGTEGCDQNNSLAGTQIRVKDSTRAAVPHNHQSQKATDKTTKDVIIKKSHNRELRKESPSTLQTCVSKSSSSSKSETSQIALAVMNVEEFLSGLKYVE